MLYPCPNVRSDKKMSDVLRNVVGRCLDKNPRMRPSASELLEEEIFKGTKSRAYLRGHLVKYVKYDMTCLGEGDEAHESPKPDNILNEF